MLLYLNFNSVSRNIEFLPPSVISYSFETSQISEAQDFHILRHFEPSPTGEVPNEMPTSSETLHLNNSDNLILVSNIERSQQLCIPIHILRDQANSCTITEIED